MLRRLLMPLAAFALLTAACGDDDDTAVDGTGDEDAGEEEPPLGPAELTAEDQTGDGSEVTVASVTLPADGYIVIHADADGSPGPVIGNSDLLTAGESSDVVVTLDEPLTESATVWPMAHIDANANGEYDFHPPNDTTDVPATFEDGDVAVVPIEYTVEGAGDDGESASAVTVEGFSFQPDTIEVEAGTSITWTNEDGVDHTVTAGVPGEPEDTFDEPLDSGASAEIALDEPGTYSYYCAIHPRMTAEIVVS